MVVVRIPTPLRKFADGRAEIEVEAKSVREAFEALEASCDGIKSRVFDDSGDVRRFINVFVNGEDIRHLKGTDTALSEGDELSIVPAIAGGSFEAGRSDKDRHVRTESMFEA